MKSRESLNAMNTKTAGYLILYGAFLIMMGLLGYLSNPEKAKTALMSGGTFGALSIVWGVLGARGVRWTLPAAMVTRRQAQAAAATSATSRKPFKWKARVG